jgi:hypothetical protein
MEDISSLDQTKIKMFEIEKTSNNGTGPQNIESEISQQLQVGYLSNFKQKLGTKITLMNHSNLEDLSGEHNTRKK